MAVAHQKMSMAAALPAVILWVLVFNNGVQQVSSFNFGSIPGIGGNSIPGLSNVGNLLGLGKCDLHIGNIFKCNEQVKNFHGAKPPESSPSTAPSSSPQQSPSATDQLPTPTPPPSSSFNNSPPRSTVSSPAESPAVSSADSPAELPAESPNYLPRSSPPVMLRVSPAPSPDGEEEADLTMEEGTLVDPAVSLVADKAADSSNSNECCRAVLHVHLNCLCSFLSLKMVMALQLAEGYLGKVASMCHIDFKGC